jgi:hypothetical protein
MRTLDFFAEYTTDTFNAIDEVTNNFPCFVNWESVEMNFIEIAIIARQEDIVSIEKIFSKIV